MNIYASFRYQLADYKKPMIVYYSVLLGVFSLFGVLACFSGGESQAATNGLSAVTAFTFAIASLFSFRESFHMALQNGVSRRCLFLGRLCVTGAACGILAAADEGVTLFALLAGRLSGVEIKAISLFELAYSRLLGDFPLSPLTALCAVLFSFFLLLAVFSAGYFVAVLFYRLNRIGRIVAVAGVPVFFLFLVPLLKELNERIMDGRIGEAVVGFLSRALRFCVGQPQNAMLTCFVLFALFSALAWPLMRRTEVK